MVGIGDCNNFYVSCIRSFNPKLIGQPVIVLSNNDKCVVARSNEAKALGIRMGQPLFQLKRKVSDYNVQVFSSNYELFGDMSRRVFNTIGRFMEHTFPYSIDELFFSASGYESIYGSHADMARMMIKTVDQWTRIPVSIGIGETMTLAKVANRHAKKHPEYQGVFVMDNPELRESILAEFPVGDLWGIGRQYEVLLKQNGIRTALELSRLPHDWIKQFMTVEGLRLVYELQGIQCRDLDTEPLHKKSICVAPSFGRKVWSYGTLCEALATYLARASEKLRRHSSAAGVVTVFIHTNRFDKVGPHHSASQSITLPHPSSSTMELLQYAEPVLKSIYKTGYDYQEVGLILNEIVPEGHQQQLLYSDTPNPRQAQLSQVVDKLNGKYGRDKIRLGLQGYDKSWKMKQDHLPPSYTTKWSDIIEVR
ncbi:Y-family DNA polymerase [Larkinella punicea]|uniref:Y-family DNA polymerase n=1 Tax=Larkinella punicea TaxID=2315727 RepID=A0A368JHH8_9BACT|nr:Y-family DNA polymerase [Larkinella punicea]